MISAPLDKALKSLERPLTVKRELLSRHALAHDASHFLLIPDAVADVRGPEGIQMLMEEARRTGLPVTFRSGGTSLSGQASGTGILADTRKGFRNLKVLEDGNQLSVEPGVTLSRANAHLLPFLKKLGPDPASEIACTIGGIIANNSSGMSCGIKENSYRTLESVEVVLPSGTVIDTARAEEDRRLAAVEPVLYNTLIRLREVIHANPEHKEKIQELFSIKNTMGFSLNAFLDFEKPIEILQRLLVGSEGTLGFVSRAVFATVPLKKYLYSGLVIFSSLQEALEAVPLFSSSGAEVIELLDEVSLRVARTDNSLSSTLNHTPRSGEAALLVEYRSGTADELNSQKRLTKNLLIDIGVVATDVFTDDTGRRAALWKVRKGLFASVAATREPGAMSILEDIAVPGQRLLPTVEALQELFQSYNYANTVIFGHARDGNLHFLLNQSFKDLREVERFEAFTDEMVDIVLSNRGTLKAEHGTGRMMAPYLEAQYGKELRDVMVAIKDAFDPEGILNPGVILNSSRTSHLESLKTVPRVDPIVDSCVECGYCENVCPSKNITLTPRQRITVLRDIEYAKEQGEYPLSKRLERQFDYTGLQTCATDGMCAIACPVSIDTGSLVKSIRQKRQKPLREKAWAFAARHWDSAVHLVARVLTIRTGSFAGLFETMTKVTRSVLGPQDIPILSRDLPKGGDSRLHVRDERPSILFLASCTGSMFGSSTGIGAEKSFISLCDRAGIRIETPANASEICCGTPWTSKGLAQGLNTMRERVKTAVEVLHTSPKTIVTDGTSCTDGYRNLFANSGHYELIDSITFAVSLLPLLPAPRRIRRIVIHPTCSSERLKISSDLVLLAEFVAEEVIIPKNWGCCGFAGDRGMLYPELTKSATEEMTEQIASLDSEAYASCNRTCEIGLSRATGKPYRNILEILEEVTSNRT